MRHFPLRILISLSTSTSIKCITRYKTLLSAHSDGYEAFFFCYIYVTPCSTLKVERRFGGIRGVHFEGVPRMSLKQAATY
jgi:hypothetical protein